MKNKYFILIVLISFFSCSKEESSTKATVNTITPINTFIGDTLTLVGHNLTNLTRISLVNEEIDAAQLVTKFVSKTDTEIKFIVPELYHENVTVYTTADNPGIEIELFGFIPYSYPNNGSIYRHAEVRQLLSNDIAFLESETFYTERFKLTNNLTDYNPLPSRKERDYSYNYTSEDSGWILTRGDTVNYSVYSFTNNIHNRSFEYNISDEDINYESISHIEYVSDNLFYIMTQKGEMYQVLNGKATNFYDIYPGLNNTPYMSDDYKTYTYSFQVLEDNSIIISPWHQNYIIRFTDTSFDVLYFEGMPSTLHESGLSKPIFFGNTGAFYSNQKIFKTNDYGLTWKEYNVDFPMEKYDGIQFLGGSQFILHDGSYRNDFAKRHKYISNDNGASWKLIFISHNVVRDLEISDQYGTAHSDQHGLFKFRKFPNGF